MSDDYVMGSLADQSSYDPMTGIPIGAQLRDDPAGSLPLWAQQANIYPQSFEPQVGMWPAYRAPASEEKPNPLVPFSGWRLDAPRRTAGSVVVEKAEPLIPTSPLEIGLTAATGGGSIPYRMGALAVGAALDPREAQAGVRDPRLWHGISSVKLSRPLSEMNPTYSMGNVVAEKLITPADLQGSWLMPGLGDRSMAGGKLLGLDDRPFNAPVWLQGGHGFMPANVDANAAWASDLGVVTRLANKTRRLAETGDVYFPYTAMGERSVDFSHHVSDTLSEMLKQQGVSKKAASAFDAKMKAQLGTDFPAVENWPGVNTPWLDAYLRSQPGVVRNKFAKVMDTRTMQDLGLPDVAQARHAVTDPRLLDVPTGAGGLSIAKLDPEGRIITRPDLPHQTYNTQLGGKYVGGFGRSVPWELLYPDMINAYRKLGFGPESYRYLMERGVTGAPPAQRATQKWVDTMSKFIERAE